ncbi:FAD-dependent monooxygenase [Streptomyces sp. NPDC052043]|uniref:FAD-dependent monooxygenase n=1 Tax=Streptomyces sp. NPDC052043 TaxID=3365684 RepID=UPI0037D58AC3
MSGGYDADVAVIGYGPTGLAAGLTLAKYGVSVVALEREESIYPRARAVTVNDWTLRIMQNLGVGDRMRQAIDPQLALRWLTYDQTEVMRLWHDPSNLGADARCYNLNQPKMEAELRAAAQDLYGDRLTIHYGDEVVKVEQDLTGVTVTSTGLDGSTRVTRAKYAIAADGGSSPTREALGIPLEGDTDGGQWIIIDCHAKRWWPNRDFLTFWTDRERPVVDVAVAAGAHRWEIPLKPSETPEDYATEDKVWPLIHSLGHDEQDVTLHQWAFYRHHVRMAKTWREGRIFLAGDAAHLMPPWAGAGMQSGVRDSYDLGWKLARVLGGELDEAVLDTYETERRPNVAFYTHIAVTNGRVIKGLASPEEVAEMSAPDPSFKVTPWGPPLTRDPVLTAGWFRGPVAADDSAIGRMIPQPRVCNPMGLERLFDDFLGEGFVLLGANVDPTTVLTPEEKAGWDTLGARYVAVRPKDAYSEAERDVIDLDHRMLDWMGRYQTTVIALRPDRFVAADDVHGLDVPELLPRS